MQFSAKQTKQQVLKRKPATLKQFLEDISWALREEDGDILNHETEVIQITQAPYAFGMEDIYKKSCSQDGLIHQRPMDNIKKKVSFIC
ncbi:uncharacterized protein LOC117318870 [Pecten maximus]|uniref:uncharacterized protein LOC117318870 n=1 Tax=Pecten maximus TaxID=6579 RepID=UPI00145897F1|nr:uncharacterized protein LOC117318870 [Pecten maximus]